MQQLSALREPLERVAALEAPSRIAALGSVLDRPWLLVLLVLLGLGTWGVVTIVAVRLAIVSAARAANMPVWSDFLLHELFGNAHSGVDTRISRR